MFPVRTGYLAGRPGCGLSGSWREARAVGGRDPGGKPGRWVVGILTTAWAAFTTVAIIYPGIGTASPDSSLPSGFAGERLQYTLTQVIPLGVMVLIGLLFYALGRNTRQQSPQ